MGTILKKSIEGEFVENKQHHKVYNKVVIDNQTSTNVKVVLVKILPDGEIKPHTHSTLEVFYILEGTGSVLVNNSYQDCSSGDTIYAPAGVEHGLKNTGSGELRVLANFPNFAQ